ncbi:MAG: hypothetical protein J6O49_01300 [Bacteroidaceae bacterium]|nr:hypothetical protein [Bacteroidaceae bacterium]
MATNRTWALKMIPVLIRWAQGAWDKPHYYSDLSAAVGHKTNQIGNVMGTIQDIIDDLKKKSGKEDIPTLNCLVFNKSSDLPSDGFDYVIKNYSKLSPDSKKGEVKKLNLHAHLYDWDWVLDALGLEPAKIFSSEDLTKMKSSSTHGFGGEGKEHKAIKEYICAHPEIIGVKKVVIAKTEYDLLSGDRLDVYFECKGNKHFAVEVKPSTSPEYDITRGIFQCVKYQAVMYAARDADYGSYNNEVLLVIAGTMSDKNRQLANDLAIKVIENFSVPKS